MATQLGKAYVQIIPSAKGISGAIQQELSGQGGLGSAGETMGTSLLGGLKGAVIGGLATLGIGAAVKQFVTGAISEGAALQQSLGGVETLFKDSASKVKAYADEAYKSTGLSANKYMENVTGFSASLLSSLHGDTARAAEAANSAMVDMSDNANKFGTDMQSIQYAYQGFAKQNYTMLDNLKLGYGGTKEEMQRLLQDAEKLTGKHFDISNFADVTEAIHAIQTEMGVTGTTAREAATTFTGSFESMKSAAQNLLGKIALGQNIAPALQSLLSSTSTFIFGNFLPMLGNIGKGILSLFDNIGPAIQNSLKGIGVNIDLSWLTGLGNSLKESFSNVFGSIKRGFNDFVEKVKPSLEPFFEKIKAFGEALAPILNSVVQMLGPVIEILFNFAAGFVNGFITGISGFLDILTPVLQFLQPVFKFLADALTSLTPIFNSVAEAIGFVAGYILGMKASLETVTNFLTETLGPIFSAVFNGIKSVFSPVVDFIKAGFNVIKSVFGAGGRAAETLGNVFGTSFNAIKTVFNTFKSVAVTVFNAVKAIIDGFLKVVSTIKDKVSHPIQSAKNAFNSLKNINLIGAGKAIIDGFLNGLRSAWDAGKHFIEKIAPWIKAKKGPIEYDRVLLKDEGQAIMQGLHEGIQTTFKDKVQPLVLGMASQIQNAFGSPTLALGGVDTTSQIEISSLAINSRLNELATAKDKETDYLETLRKLAERPTVVSLKLDENEFARLTAEPISKEQEYNKTILDRLKGENRWL